MRKSINGDSTPRLFDAQGWGSDFATKVHQDLATVTKFSDSFSEKEGLRDNFLKNFEISENIWNKLQR